MKLHRIWTIVNPVNVSPHFILHATKYVGGLVFLKVIRCGPQMSVSLVNFVVILPRFTLVLRLA